MANLNDERAKFLADLMGMGEDESISPEVAKEAAEMPATKTITVEMTDEDRGDTYTETMTEAEYTERFGQPEPKPVIRAGMRVKVHPFTYTQHLSGGAVIVPGKDRQHHGYKSVVVSAVFVDDVAGDDQIEVYVGASGDVDEVPVSACEIIDSIKDLDDVMTAGEVAQVYKLAEATVRQTINRGQLPARKSGGTWLVRRADAEARWGDKSNTILWHGAGWYAQHPGKMQSWQPKGVWFKVDLPHISRERAVEDAKQQGLNPDTLTLFESNDEPAGWDIRGPLSENLHTDPRTGEPFDPKVRKGYLKK